MRGHSPSPPSFLLRARRRVAPVGPARAALGALISTALLLATGALRPETASAARWLYYTVGSGLPSNDVRKLAAAADGSVWAATPVGLVRYFDGVWSVVSPQRFDAVTLDATGVLWAAGQAGQVQWFAADGHALTTPDIGLSHTSNDDVLSLAAGPGGEVWLGTLTALWHWHSGATGWVADLVHSGRIRALHVSSTGKVWWGEDLGLGTILNGSPAVVAPPQQGGNWPPDRSVWAVHALADESVVLGTASGKAWWSANGSAFSSVPLPASSVVGFENPVLDVLEDARGRVWLARGEAHRFDRTDYPQDPSRWVRKSFGAEDGLSGSNIFALLEAVGTGASKGSRALWFGTDLGVSVLSSFAWTAFTTSNGLAGQPCELQLAGCSEVTAIAPDPAHNVVWFGATAGLSRLRNGSEWTGWLNQLFGGPLTHPQIRALHADADGTLWVANGDDAASTSAVQYHRPGQDDSTWPVLGQGAVRWRVAAIDRDDAGLLWLAAGDGAWRLDDAATPMGETQFTVANGLPAPPLTALDAGEGHVAVGARGALAVYDIASSAWTSLPFTALIPGSGATVEVRSVLLRGGKLFAATSVGLIVADAAAASLAGASVLDGGHGFADDLRALADPGDGFLLVASVTGLFRLDLDLSRWHRLGVSDGLPAEDLLSVAVDGDGLWVGTRGDGAATHSFEMPDTRVTLAPPAVVTTRAVGVVVQVDAMDPDSDLAQIFFQWRVDDGTWSTPSPDRTITFVPASLVLQDGVHTFGVRAVDPEFNVDPTPALAVFELDTTPPVPKIAAPGADDVLRGTIAVRGTATDPRFDRYTVTVWRKGTPAAQADTLLPWTPTPVNEAQLATWDTRDVARFPDDRWELRVTLRDQLGVEGYTQIEVLVDNVAPFADVTSPVLVRGDLGATVYSANGDAVVFVPPFAMAGERLVTVDREAVADSPASAGARLGPADLALAKKTTLRLRASAQAESGGALAIYRKEQDASWTRLGGTREDAGSGQAFYSTGVDGPGLYALRSDIPPVVGGGAVITTLSAEPRYFSPRSGGLEGRMSISFSLGHPAPVKAVVYNRAGRLRRELADGLTMDSGQHVLFWDGRDTDGAIVATGLYIVCVEAGSERVTKVIEVGRK
jgi:ligand-binding sensor domain-containing protein